MSRERMILIIVGFLVVGYVIFQIGYKYGENGAYERGLNDQYVQFLQKKLEEGPKIVQGPPGPQGIAGINGIDGRDGKDGKNGLDGEQGPPGESGRLIVQYVEKTKEEDKTAKSKVVPIFTVDEVEQQKKNVKVDPFISGTTNEDGMRLPPPNRP